MKREDSFELLNENASCGPHCENTASIEILGYHKLSLDSSLSDEDLLCTPLTTPKSSNNAMLANELNVRQLTLDDKDYCSHDGEPMSLEHRIEKPPSTFSLMLRNQGFRAQPSKAAATETTSSLPLVIEFLQYYGHHMLIILLVGVIFALLMKLHNASLREVTQQHKCELMIAQSETEIKRLTNALESIYNEVFALQKKFSELQRNAVVIPGLRSLYEMVCRATNLCSTFVN